LAPLAVVATLIAASALSTAAPAWAHHADGPCDFHPVDGETVEHFSTRQIRCAVERFGAVPGGARRAVCIADRESGLIPDATSLTGDYLGLFQHASKYWDSRYDEWTRPVWDLPTSALKGRTNAIVTIRMVHRAGGWKAAGWPRFDC
jgi:hypothetical protein